MATQALTPDERLAFFLLKEIMELVLIIENGKAESYHYQKLEEVRSKLQTLLPSAPSIGIEYLQEVWQECFFLAKEQVEKEYGISIPTIDISWQQVFDTVF